jgi:hypothetical protein
MANFLKLSISISIRSELSVTAYLIFQKNDENEPEMFKIIVILRKK